MVKNPTPYSPADVGYCAQRLDVLDNHFRKMMDKGDLMAASYVLSRDGKVFAHSADGAFSCIEGDDRQIDCNTLYFIASETKLFTALSIMKLAEDGLISLNQPVGDFIEAYKTAPFDKINIAHLMSHSSGMYPDGGCLPDKTGYWRTVDYVRKEHPEMHWTEASTYAGVRMAPDKEWAYCSFGFVLLGEIITRVAGIRAEQYIIDNILTPCEMTDSCFPYFNATPDQLDRVQVRGEWVKTECGWAKNPDTLPEDEKYWQYEVPATAGGLISCPQDLIKFANMLLNNGTYNGKRIVGRKTVEKFITEHICLPDYCWNTPGTLRHYALGPDLRSNLTTFYSEGTFFHEGAGSCSLIMDPKEKLAASYFVPYTNGQWFAEGLYNAAAIIWSGLE